MPTDTKARSRRRRRREPAWQPAPDGATVTEPRRTLADQLATADQRRTQADRPEQPAAAAIARPATDQPTDAAAAGADRRDSHQRLRVARELLRSVNRPAPTQTTAPTHTDGGPGDRS